MARSKSDISNSAIRIFLQDVGKFYDEERGFEPFGPKVAQKDELLGFFNNECCFCGTKIDRKSLSQDHLIPMNKTSLGLHAWGNVVPCCSPCNSEKQQKPWNEFIQIKAGNSARIRTEKIDAFVTSKNYDPNLNLHEFADNLYEDVGQVAMTLINLRYKQAQDGIKKLLG
ncbi:MAG: HNH endonuclease [Porticoccus sp.]